MIVTLNGGSGSPSKPVGTSCTLGPAFFNRTCNAGSGVDVAPMPNCRPSTTLPQRVASAQNTLAAAAISRAPARTGTGHSISHYPSYVEHRRDNGGSRYALTEASLGVGRVESFSAAGGHGTRHGGPSGGGLRSRSALPWAFLTLRLSLLPVPGDRQRSLGVPGCCAGSSLPWRLGRALPDARTSISVLQGKSAHSTGNRTGRRRFPVVPSGSGEGGPCQDT